MDSSTAGAPHFWRIRSNLVGVPTAVTIVAAPAPRRATDADAGGGGDDAAAVPKKVDARGAASGRPGTKAAIMAGAPVSGGGGG